MSCNICSSTRALVSFRGRARAKCPQCGSLERHRGVFPLLQAELSGFSETLLHFAPEKFFKPVLSELAGLYLTVDLKGRAAGAMIAADICKLPFNDESIGMVYCSHVLEHVRDHIRALTELYRVLKFGGVAIIQVPLVEGTTFTTSKARTPALRKRYYGQSNHVRQYGRKDIASILSTPGFEVETKKTSGGLVFMCRKDLPEVTQ